MGMKYRRYLAGERIYGCLECKTHLATIHSMISRAFNGQHGRAYLFDGVVNVVEGEPSDRQMTTGNHTVRDIYCVKCATILGWKYVCIHLSSPQTFSRNCDHRIEHMKLPRNTKRENISSSAIFLSTFNKRCLCSQPHWSTRSGPHGISTSLGRYFDDGLTARVDLDNPPFKFSPRSHSFTTHCDS
ncbi:yippee zinc-binding/DNA-binding /Mis18, centromere assembly-domain-containing protein [Lanmaoa asiatica]|nr:yippee zinc-binding/DNA-binding /Mis18, centromere assembly-domain-containing protein [Lanmaoa asiatica]